jgi:[acyl-carrier-protein] S-malonyltransferase
MSRAPNSLDKDRLAATAFFFRGYNTTNLGRSTELLAHPAYGPIVEPYLKEAGQICADVTGQPVDLVGRVRRREETDLNCYADAVALIVAMELAQIHLLREFFGIDYTQARMAYGYSLGELAALVAGGVMDMRDALRVPLAVSADCVALAADTTLGVLFSRGPALDGHAVERLCLRINQAGHGVIGISAYLSPNSLLLHGQGNTIDRFAELMPEWLPQRLHLRKNDSLWPPLHTPIVWQRNIPNRAAVLMHTIAGGMKPPVPPILSMATGKLSYDDVNCRQIMAKWIDHPQRLWDAIYETLAQGIELVVHVGPEPNLGPATFTRLSDNVRGLLSDRSISGFGMRAMSQAVRRPWLARLLPNRSALLRAPLVEQIVLEDWLLAHAPVASS